MPIDGAPAPRSALGAAPFLYDLQAPWGRLPRGWSLGDVGGVAVDAADNVFVFNRGPRPMIVFDRDGEVLTHWGEGVFTRPHGVDIGPDGSVYCTDDGDHTVRKCTPDGRVLLEIGVPGAPAPAMSGRPFNRCTHTALSPEGEIYVSDGYANARVHKFTAQGEFLFSWGWSGAGPGQFNLPHNICTDDDGRVIVADRENDRIQVFDSLGRLVDIWGGVRRPCAMCCDPTGGGVYVGELGSGDAEAGGAPPRVSLLGAQGQLMARLGDRRADSPFVAPHGIAVDSRGDLYLGEVAYRAWALTHPHTATPPHLTTLSKLVRRRPA